MKKIAFANYLRGLAAIIVIISHYFGIFYANPIAVHELLRINNTMDSHSAFYSLYSLFHFSPYISYGHIGVALFFLISGFVIPFSLDKYPPEKFIINRFFRIYPTYWLALSITIVCLVYNSYITHSELNLDIYYVLKQALLVRDLYWLPSIDGVSWTLEIEMKFYFISLIFYNVFKNKIYSLFLTTFLLISLVITVMNYPLFCPVNLRNVILFDVPFLIFMLIGNIFNIMHKKKITQRKGMLLASAYFVVFNVLLYCNISKNAYVLCASNYGISLFLFGSCYLKQKIFSNNSVLEFLAKVSFPLYVVHGVLGYSMLESVIRNDINVYLGVMITLISVLTIAFCIHKYVEEPTRYFSRKIL